MKRERSEPRQEDKETQTTDHIQQSQDQRGRPDGDDDEAQNVDVRKRQIELKVSNISNDTKLTLENYPQSQDHIKSERIASRFLF